METIINLYLRITFLARFPLGSGINGNDPGSRTSPYPQVSKPASLWEVELMETL
ncbi:hypothetical protein CRC_01657 [Cylindrospermopsis raciborskii CS-505]|nr:hypothetical protein CRC_01657 [Cylindrospermopsis raciborskii CS-505]